MEWKNQEGDAVAFRCAQKLEVERQAFYGGSNSSFVLT